MQQVHHMRREALPPFPEFHRHRTDIENFAFPHARENQIGLTSRGELCQRKRERGAPFVIQFPRPAVRGTFESEPVSATAQGP